MLPFLCLFSIFPATCLQFKLPFFNSASNKAEKLQEKRFKLCSSGRSVAFLVFSAETMMDKMCLAVLFLFMALSASASSAAVISDSVFDSHISTGRNLLQAKKACPVNFEFLNYTTLTSKCKGPTYPATTCCAAFKEFACPYADEINDETTECASTMFSYINLNGKYPPGLFASECKEGKLGLACTDSPPALSAEASGSQSICSPSSLLIVTVGFLVLLFKRL